MRKLFMSSKKKFVVLGIYLLVIAFQGLVLAANQQKKEAMTVISKEDLEVIKNLELLQDLEVIQGEDIALLKNYDDLENIDQNKKDSYEYKKGQ